MSRLLLAKAARVCGWHDCDEWPELVTARELATLQDDSDLERILPPQGAGLLPERPRYAAARGGYSTSAPALVPAYNAVMVRGLLAGVELSPMLAAWLDAHAPQESTPQDAPALAETSPSKPETRQTEINRWLRDTWEAEGRPGGAAFFRKLKGYKCKPGSPIIEWYQAGKDAGIGYETSAGARDNLSKKAIQNKVSKWRNPAAPSNP